MDNYNISKENNNERTAIMVLNRIIEKLYFLQKKNLALYDQFTGVYNRNWLMKIGHKMYEDTEIYITMIDINNLKTVNDTYGHIRGNYVILGLVSIIEKSFSEFDMKLVRYGGDEFILFSKKDPSAILQESYILADEDGDRALFSYGVYHKSSEESLQAVIQKADSAMYDMKRRVKRNKK